MPDKWHGIILGNDEGAEAEWQRVVAEASQRAKSLATVITLTFVRGGGEVVFKNTYESLSVDGRCVPITERTSLT